MKLNGTNGNVQATTFPVVMVTPEQEIEQKRQALVVMHNMLEGLRKENAQLTEKASSLEGKLATSAVIIDKLRDRYSDSVNEALRLRKGLRSEEERRREAERELAEIKPAFFRYQRIPRIVRVFFRVVFRLKSAKQNVFAPLQEE